MIVHALAIAHALQQPLEFNQESWERVVERLKAYKIEIPENNHQHSGCYAISDQATAFSGRELNQLKKAA